ncbi:MAG: LysM peptidoglycan-binding domain-containing protein [Bacteroidota bacterium]
MKKILLVALLLSVLQGFALQNLYTKHTIEKGETIYSISKLYGVSIEEIKNTNPGIDISKIKLGGTINIPLQVKNAASSNNNNTSTTVTTTNAVKTTSNPTSVSTTNTTTKTHVVKAGESLYSIAKLYGVSINDLTSWNKITTNSIQIGQRLQIASTSTTTVNTSKPTTTTTVPTKTTDVKITAIDEDVTDPTSNIRTSKTTNTTASTNTNTVVKPSTTTTSSNAINSNYYTTKTTASGKTEKGIGMSMVDAGDNPNYIALYSGAAIGSMITVKNLMNNKSITAKVVGKIPSLDRNKDVLVKISSNAYTALGALDEKFLVEVVY